MKARLGRAFLAAALTALTALATLCGPVSAASPLATVGSDGVATACLGGNQSTVDPGSATTNGILSLNDQSCPGSTAGGGSGSAGGSGSSNGSGASSSGNGSASEPASGGTTNSTSRSTTASSVKTSNARTTTSGGAAAAVAAAKAAGIRFASVSYAKFPSVRRNRLLVHLTIRDTRHRLVSGAIVRVSGILGAKATLSLSRSAFTNRHGRVSFWLPLTRKMGGHHLLLRLNAHTPTASAFRLAAPLLPAST